MRLAVELIASATIRARAAHRQKLRRGQTDFNQEALPLRLEHRTTFRARVLRDQDS